MLKHKILLLGNIEGSYRSQYIINYLSQKNYDLSFIYFGKWGPIKKESFFSRLTSFLLRKVLGVFYLLFLPGATHVLMLPLNERFDGIFKLAHLLGKKTIMDFYSSRDYGKNLQIGQAPLSKKRITRLMKFDRNVILHADELIFLNRGDAEYYLQEIGFSGEEVSYKIIPLATPLRAKAKLNGFRTPSEGFTLCWWGKAAKVHGVDIMLEAVHLLKHRTDKFCLYLMDINPDRAKLLEEDLRRYDLQDVATVRWDLSFADGLEAFLVEHCDIALGSFGLSKLAKVGLSNKIVDAISMGIPMVTVNTAAIAEFELDKGLLSVCEPDPSDICDQVLQLMTRDFNIDAYQQAAMDAHKGMFSPERFYKHLDDLFN
jgi:glycosyltransferase involved in cell wall biosynthesis